METQNPDYKYYRQLAGTWKSYDGACTATLTATVGITVSYGGAVLEGQYGVISTGNMMTISQGMTGFAGMLSFANATGDMTYRHNPNEDIQLKLGDRSLKDGGQTVFNIDFAWHDTSDRLHFELSNVNTGAIVHLTLDRETVAAEPLKEGEYRCECGQVFTSRFCPNCGSERKEKGSFTCECGYTGTVSNFCPECGKPRPGIHTRSAVTQPAVPEMPDDNKTAEPEAGWTCSECGATLQTGEKCTGCGADIRKEPLFAISEYTTANPPSYDGITIWKFSDTRLIMQRGENYRFIPATVIEPAMEIIRKYEIDKWEEYKGHLSGMMGGNRSVNYWDGGKMAGASMDQMPGVSGAYFDLKELFTTAQDG